MDELLDKTISYKFVIETTLCHDSRFQNDACLSAAKCYPACPNLTRLMFQSGEF